MKIFLKIIFVAYWAITLIYVSPDNFIKVKADRILRPFGILCAQEWAFFAPPPQGNNRLYYTFYDDQDKFITTFEVLQPLFSEKQRKAPWNTREEAIDYIVNGAVGNLTDFIITQREIYQQLHPDSTLTVVEQMARRAITERHSEIPPFKTLTEYGKIVANRNLSPEKYSKVNSQVITVTEKKLPKFMNRSNLVNDSILVEGLLLETPLIPINPINIVSNESN